MNSSAVLAMMKETVKFLIAIVFTTLKSTAVSMEKKP